MYVPADPVWAVFDTCVASFVTVTLAFATMAPLESVTVPSMLLNVWLCPSRAVATVKKLIAMAAASHRCTLGKACACSMNPKSLIYKFPFTAVKSHPEAIVCVSRLLTRKYIAFPRNDTTKI